MERRRALAIAGATAVSLLAAGGALAANVGLLEASETDSDVGGLDAATVRQLVEPATEVTAAVPTTEGPTTTVIYVDEYVTPDGRPTSPPGVSPSGGATVLSSDAAAPDPDGGPTSMPPPEAGVSAPSAAPTAAAPDPTEVGATPSTIEADDGAAPTTAGADAAASYPDTDDHGDDDRDGGEYEDEHDDESDSEDEDEHEDDEHEDDEHEDDHDDD